MDVMISDKTKRKLVEGILDAIEDSQEIKEFFDKLSEAETDNLHQRILQSVDDFFEDVTLSIEY